MRMSIERNTDGRVDAWAHGVGDKAEVRASSEALGQRIVLTVSSFDRKLNSAIVFADIPTAERAAAVLATAIKAKAAFKERDKDE